MPLSDFQPVIGLEVHAQLLTRSKIFSGASTEFGGQPNAHTQALCVGLPGALPVLNEAVVQMAIRTGLALDCRVNETSEWSRKQYFYPDMPKGYQITQYEFPICEHGKLVIDTPRGERAIRIRRIHMEEDAGKSVHDAGGGLSLVDLNRAGTPLLEIVSEPDLRTADEAVEYLKSLREVLMYLGVNDGNLEEGSFRCDANVSVMKKGTEVLGTRCELKNLNSFRFIKQAIEYEAGRQVEVLEAGQQVDQQTRLFDPQRGETRPMRSKEEAQDYRYFPDPDLPPLHVARARIDQARLTLPELPRARRARYVAALKLPAYDAGVLTASQALADFFEKCLAEYADAKKLSNWFMGELSRLVNEKGTRVADFKFSPAQLAALMKAVDGSVISGSSAKEVFAEMFDTGRAPEEIIAEKGLAQVSDASAIEPLIDQVMADNAKNVESYRAGRTQLLGFFVGQVMKETGGAADPRVVNERVRELLSR